MNMNFNPVVVMSDFEPSSTEALNSE
ncbi:unnamed protein product, partial [Rotaria sp. Silwood1]